MELYIDRLTKKYGNKIAVDNFTAKLSTGVYGLLGANGAGKTTLMRMMSDILKPTSGDILLDGISIYDLEEEYRNILGYLPQSFGFYKSFTATDFLMYLSAAKGIEKNLARERTNELLTLVGLNDVAKKKIKTFSGGMQQRLGIAQALLNNPSVLILDEPTAGLDPKERIRFRNLISDISANCIVLLSTHIVSDLDNIASKILMMKKGVLVINGTYDEVANLAADKVWNITASVSQAEEIRDKYMISALKQEENRIELRIISEEKPALDAIPQVPTLEDAYLYCFGEK